MNARHFARLTAPDGTESFLCFAHPGKTSDPLAATAFLDARVARQAAAAVVYGEPAAFWNSERRAAENTRREHKGYSFAAVPVADYAGRRVG